MVLPPCYRVDGPDDAPVLVLGPSLGTTHDVWAPQMPALAASWRVIRYDLPGHVPGTALPSGEPTVDDLAAGVLSLVTDLGVGRFAIGGVSLGGAIAATAAVRAPDRVERLVLCCTSARFGDPEPWRERAGLVRRAGMAPMVDTLIDRWFTGAYARDRPAPVRRITDMLNDVDPEGYARCCTAIASYDLRDRLPEITAPTLVIAGADDPSTPVAHAEILTAGIPGAELAVIPGAAHLANVQRPDLVTPRITAHLTARDEPGRGE
ncbi:MAG TPA: 3-oxoadipate enol-lactonase [Streptosporangiaceae bacterium]|jgi:3-oxoadipate enol-lactonase